MRRAKGMSSRKISAPPMATSSSASFARPNAWPSEWTTTTPSNRQLRSRVRTRLVRPGSALPRPIAPFSAIATMRETSGCCRIMALRRREVSDLDHGVEHDHAPEGHAEKLRRLRAVALHPGEESPLQPLPTRQRPGANHVLADEERAVLAEYSQASRPTGFERLTDIRGFHEPESGVDEIDTGQRFLDLDPAHRILARGAHDFDVENDEALVHDTIVLDVADQRRGHEVRIAGEEHAGPGDTMRPVDHLRQLAARHGHLGECRPQVQPPAAPRHEYRKEH